MPNTAYTEYMKKAIKANLHRVKKEADIMLLYDLLMNMIIDLPKEHQQDSK